MAKFAKLNNFQIWVLKYLLKSGAMYAPKTVPYWAMEFMPRLWRRGLVETWYRQQLEGSPSLRGGYFTLTVAGWRLADALMNAAPRADSGAGKKQ